MNNNQSSVDFIIESVISRGIYTKEMLEEFEQAKEIHKHEIIDAVNQTEFIDIDGYGICETYTKGEQYYNETFKGNNE